MLVITLLLMMWASMARMHELPVQYPPCFFNPLCTCSKAIPDLGIVACHNVPMPRIPQQINSSKVFMLQLENNGLRFLQPQYLMNTGAQLNYNVEQKIIYSYYAILFSFNSDYNCVYIIQKCIFILIKYMHMDFLFFETISHHIVLLKCKFSIISQDDY